MVVGAGEVSVGEQHLVVADAGGLHALLALLGDEGDSLALLKGLETVLLRWESVGCSEMQQVMEAQHTSMARKWTKRSAEPFSGVMKPYPFSSLNHLTVPFWRSEGAAASILRGVYGLFWWVVRWMDGWMEDGLELRMEDVCG
jgi:hypothetical protein